MKAAKVPPREVGHQMESNPTASFFDMVDDASVDMDSTVKRCVARPRNRA